MALSIPLVWSDDHRLHEPEAEIWVGVRTPAARCRRGPRRSGRRSRRRGRGGRRRRVTTTRRSRRCTTRRCSRFSPRAWRDWEAAGLPGRPRPGSGRAVHLPPPRPDGRARAARAGRDVGAAGSVLLRHDDADRARHLGGRARGGGRRADRRRPRRRRRTGRVRLLPPARPSRDPQRLRRLVLPEQRRDRGAAAARARRRAGRRSSTSTPITATAPSDLLGARRRVHRLGARRSGDGLVSHFLGTAAERGAGAGRGANLNVPLPPGAGDADWLARGGRDRAGGAQPRRRGARRSRSVSMRRAATPRARSR